MEASSQKIKGDHGKPSQQTFDKRFAAVVLCRSLSAVNTVEQLRRGDRRDREIFFRMLGKQRFKVELSAFSGNQNA